VSGGVLVSFGMGSLSKRRSFPSRHGGGEAALHSNWDTAETALQSECRRVDMEKSAPTARERFACTQEAICGMVFSAMKDKP